MDKCIFIIACAAATGMCGLASGHGYVGGRFFPATIATDDPLVTDELALPMLSLAYAGSGDEQARTVDASFDFSKLIVPRLALDVGADYQWLRPRGGQASQGWNNLELGLKYQAWENEEHEAVVSVGLEAEVGGTGSKRVGRAGFSTFTPTVYFGKGFGDLPEGLSFLKPLAVTGSAGVTFPGEAADANALEWGLAVEYQLPYLQQRVKDVGLPSPWKEMIPVVEFSFETPLNRGGGMTTGTVNPGVLWEGRYMQVGIEAVLPVNRESGEHVGVMIQTQIYIDDLLPRIFGHPLFGE